MCDMLRKYGDDRETGAKKGSVEGERSSGTTQERRGVAGLGVEE